MVSATGAAKSRSRTRGWSNVIGLTPGDVWHWKRGRTNGDPTLSVRSPRLASDGSSAMEDVVPQATKGARGCASGA